MNDDKLITKYVALENYLMIIAAYSLRKWSKKEVLRLNISSSYSMVSS